MFLSSYGQYLSERTKFVSDELLETLLEMKNVVSNLFFAAFFSTHGFVYCLVNRDTFLLANFIVIEN